MTAPPQLARAVAASVAARAGRREAGLAGARAWREANRSYFDALYGPERCPSCGSTR
ncbi:MAG TPA: hypothetical protein VGW34_04965 [Allosphingosinicella sp.]|nr:hypothetical protein [Allosphingosinicella sp.]